MAAVSFLGNIERFRGTEFAEIYNRNRPTPPPILREIICQYAGICQKPRLVVDIGCGTGLSTLYWASHAESIIGVDPTEDMLSMARKSCSSFPNISFTQGTSTHTNLEAGIADIVTSSQSLHWMEPQPTFEEVKRILRPGGVFAAYDYDLPPTLGIHTLEQLFDDMCSRAKEIGTRHGILNTTKSWEKELHLKRMAESNCFAFTKEVVMHNVEKGDGERFALFARSMGHANVVLRAGVATEEDIGLTALRQKANELLSQDSLWIWGYRVRLGVRA